MLLRHAAALLAISLSLAACAIDTPTPDAGKNVIVGFAEPVRGDDPVLLEGLAAAHLQLHFVASMSPRSHVYRLTCSGTAGCERQLDLLKAQPGITYVQFDQIKELR